MVVCKECLEVNEQNELSHVMMEIIYIMKITATHYIRASFRH